MEQDLKPDTLSRALCSWAHEYDMRGQNLLEDWKAISICSLHLSGTQLHTWASVLTDLMWEMKHITLKG